MDAGQEFLFTATTDCETLRFTVPGRALTKTPKAGPDVGSRDHTYKVVLTDSELRSAVRAVDTTFTWSVTGTTSSGVTSRVDTTNEIDLDGDGWTRSDGDIRECDASAAVHPGVTETCDGIDQNCDGAADEDLHCQLSGTLYLEAVQDDGTIRCDTTIGLTGVPFTGTCPGCDFVYDVSAEILDEAGTSCPNPELFAYDSDLLSPWWPENSTRLLGFAPNWYASPLSNGFYDVLWFGMVNRDLGFPLRWASWNEAWEWPYLDVTLEEGVLTWVQEYPNYAVVMDLGFCRTYYVGTPEVGDHGGPYAADGTVPCSYSTTYDRWSFVAPADEDVHIAVDTVSERDKFDPYLALADSSSCFLGAVNDSFECTYVPSSGRCPSYRLPVTKGEVYDVIVYDAGDCAASMGGYEIRIAASGDPLLVLRADDQPRYGFVDVHLSGSATISNAP